MGSEDDCGGWDYLPNARVERDTDYKPSPAWPGDVKRCHMYAPDALITHPLVSPIAAESWKGSPPVWMSVGDECLRDSNCLLNKTHDLNRRYDTLPANNFSF